MATPKKKSPKKAAKPAAKKPTYRPAAKKPAAPKKAVKTVAKKPVAKKSPKPVGNKATPKTTVKTVAKAKPAASKAETARKAAPAKAAVKAHPVKLTPFLEKQKERLLILKDTLLDSMNGVAKDSLRSRAEGSEASAFGMHQADAGSDAYDRDFALSLLSQEQDSLYEIDEALKRVENGAYGICEISGKAIPHARLEALPFTRYTVECQAELEKRNRFTRVRQPVTSLFGLSDEDGGDDDEESSSDSKE